MQLAAAACTKKAINTALAAAIAEKSQVVIPALYIRVIGSYLSYLPHRVYRIMIVPRQQRVHWQQIGHTRNAR